MVCHGNTPRTKAATAELAVDINARNHSHQQFNDACPRDFTYNGDGLRTSHTSLGLTTNYTWDVAAGLPVILEDGTNRYVYGLDLISATNSPATGRFLSRDPLPNGNPYAYADNNPISFVDPTGQIPSGPMAKEGRARYTLIGGGSWWCDLPP